MRRTEQPEYFMTRVLMSHEKFYFARLFNILACSRAEFFPSRRTFSLYSELPKGGLLALAPRAEWKFYCWIQNKALLCHHD